MDITEILTNPLVWGVLAWLFSRLFTSKNKEETPNNQPNHKESRSRPVPTPRVNPTHAKNRVDDKTRKEVESTIHTVQHAYENIKARVEEQIDDVTVVKMQPKKTQIDDFPKVNRNANQNHLLIDRQKAVQGVVWSEILGAPRSKNPHYTRKRRHS